MSYFANGLKQLRLEHGLTQAALARELHVTQNAIFNWENEKREPSIDMIYKIADYFGTTIVYLLDGKENAKHPPRFAGELINGKVPQFTAPITSSAPQEAYDVLHSLIDKEGIGDTEREEVSRQLRKILQSFKGLNETGRRKAVERIEELYMIPKYIFDNFPDNIE